MATPNVKNCIDPFFTEVINYSNFPGLTIGNTVLFESICYEITGPSGGLNLAQAQYTDCYECFASNNTFIIAISCDEVVKEQIGELFINITDFGFIPQTGDVYYLSFFSPKFGGLITSCFQISGVKPFAEPPQSAVVTLITPPVLETDCENCVINNQKPYIVTRCTDGSPDYINLLDDSYNGHTITYTVGLDRYCGVVNYQQFGTVNGVFVSDFSSENNDDICASCNSSVGVKRILTNCLNGTQEVVWESPYFQLGDVSHLDSKYGCFTVGNTTTDPVTLPTFLDFDPQPSCQDCIQCNGISLTLSLCSDTGYTINVLSYQYADVGDVIFNPYENECMVVTNITTPQLYDYIFYSFFTGGTDCTACQSLGAPISYYGKECVTGKIVVITFDATSTITTGDFVRAKWGTSDFLCYEIGIPWDGTLSDQTEFYYSDTTTSFTSCDECKNNTSLGVTLVNCNTYVEKYVNVDIPTWITMTGYDDGLGLHVVKGKEDGQCYYLVNSCPIPALYNTFETTNEFYYYCFQCTPTEPNYCCDCYVVTNNNVTPIYLQYLDCDNNLITTVISGETSSTFCSKDVKYLNAGNYTSVVPRNTVVTVDVCVNGKCLSTLSTKDQLLYKLNTTLGPCPSNCCGKNASAGAYLLRNNGNTPETYSIR